MNENVQVGDHIRVDHIGVVTRVSGDGWISYTTDNGRKLVIPLDQPNVSLIRRPVNQVAFIGGPIAGAVTSLSNIPARVQVGDRFYDAINDPETGQFLGAYVIVNKGSA